MSEDENYCSNCGIKCEQSLMLYCDHNLCMKCAGENLVRNDSQGLNKDQYIICDICQTKTEIDTQTVKEVLSLGFNTLSKNSLNNININNNTFPKLDMSNSDLQNSIKATTNLINTNKINLKNININNNNSFNRLDINNIKKNYEINNICKEHGEPITYLCLECMSKSICIECVINGFHRNHGVLNIKNAYPLIYDKTHDISNFLDNKIKELESTDKIIEQKKKDINYLNNKCKIDITQAFDELRNLLNKKEKEILSKTLNTLDDTLNQLNKYSNMIQNKLVLLNKLFQNVNANLNKDEVTLIHFYNDNKNKILSQIDINEMNSLSNINFEAMPNPNMDIIDKNSFDAMISAINSLNFNLNTFRGLIFEKQYNFGKFTSNSNFYDNNSMIDNNNIFGLNVVNINEMSNNIINEEIND